MMDTLAEPLLFLPCNLAGIFCPLHKPWPHRLLMGWAMKYAAHHYSHP